MSCAWRLKGRGIEYQWSSIYGKQINSIKKTHKQIFYHPIGLNSQFPQFPLKEKRYKLTQYRLTKYFTHILTTKRKTLLMLNYFYSYLKACICQAIITQISLKKTSTRLPSLMFTGLEMCNRFHFTKDITTYSLQV